MKDRFDLACKYANTRDVYVFYLVSLLKTKPREIVRSIESVDGVSMGKFRTIPSYTVIEKEDDVYDFIVDLGTNDEKLAKKRGREVILIILEDHANDIDIKRFSLIKPTKKVEKRLPKERELYKEFETLMLRGV